MMFSIVSTVLAFVLLLVLSPSPPLLPCLASITCVSNPVLECGGRCEQTQFNSLCTGFLEACPTCCIALAEFCAGVCSEECCDQLLSICAANCPEAGRSAPAPSINE